MTGLKIINIVLLSICGWALIGFIVAAFLDTTGTVTWWFLKIMVLSGLPALGLSGVIARSSDL